MSPHICIFFTAHSNNMAAGHCGWCHSEQYNLSFRTPLARFHGTSIQPCQLIHVWPLLLFRKRMSQALYYSSRRYACFYVSRWLILCLVHSKGMSLASHVQTVHVLLYVSTESFRSPRFLTLLYRAHDRVHARSCIGGRTVDSPPDCPVWPTESNITCKFLKSRWNLRLAWFSRLCILISRA